jgi:hypothetical protein
MKKLGKELEFISFVRRDGSGNEEEFEINTISMTYKTFIASGFNTWVVRLK